MTVPDHLRHYPCEGYFASEWAASGEWDELGQTMLILPASEIEERPELPFLIVSRFGDGLALGFRPDLPGFWGYASEVDDFVLISSSIEEFVQTFYAGREGL